jgi:hypothetical protein
MAIGFESLDLARANLVKQLDALAPGQGGDVLSVMEAIDRLIQIRITLLVQNSQLSNGY